MTTMTTDEGLLSRMTLKLRQRMCGLHGHDSLLHFDNGRISLLCYSCGHESPGWEVGGAANAPRPVSSRSATPMVHLPYAGERRVA
jgi:hypothetical protein